MCEFCNDPIYIKRIQYSMPFSAPVTRVEKLRHELLNLTGEVYLEFPKNYCPNCGAKMDFEVCEISNGRFHAPGETQRFLFLRRKEKQ